MVPDLPHKAAGFLAPQGFRPRVRRRLERRSSAVEHAGVIAIFAAVTIDRYRGVPGQGAAQ
jgi:hypothetical protein